MLFFLCTGYLFSFEPIYFTFLFAVYIFDSYLLSYSSSPISVLTNRFSSLDLISIWSSYHQFDSFCTISQSTTFNIFAYYRTRLSTLTIDTTLGNYAIFKCVTSPTSIFRVYVVLMTLMRSPGYMIFVLISWISTVGHRMALRRAMTEMLYVERERRSHLWRTEIVEGNSTKKRTTWVDGYNVGLPAL